MKMLAILAALALWAGSVMPAAALTPEEVIRLKKAGVSDETIRMMMEQERLGGLKQGPVEETKDEIIYRAGNPARVQRNKRHERWKEEKSMEAVGNVIIDSRQSTR